MTLESFLSTTENKKPTVEWDGKDFRGDRCDPGDIQYIRNNPILFKWLRAHPRKYVHSAVSHLKFCFEYLGIRPDEFLKLDRKVARDKAWDYLESIRFSKPSTARYTQTAMASFYRYYNEENLVWIKGKHDIVVEPVREKLLMSKENVWKIISKTRNLHDETLLTFDYESGLRENAVSHMTLRHYHNFDWYRQKENHEWVKADEDTGTIAMFKVMATANKDYTWDNKLRGKGLFGYVAGMHKEASALMKQYVREEHKGSSEDTMFWKVQAEYMARIIKHCAKRANLKSSSVNFHALRRGFRSVLRDSGISDDDVKEFLMGHRIKGARENYFESDPMVLLREYSKCDFSPTAEIIAEKEREIAELKRQLAERVMSQPKPQIQPITELKPLGKEATREEINQAFKDFNSQQDQKPLEKQDVAIPKVEASATSEASITPQKPITQPRPTMESIIQKAIDEKRCLRGNDLSNYPEKYRQIACNWCYINKRDYYDRCQATMKQKV